MAEYNFDNLVFDLEMGREIEFCFDGNHYGIINANGYWYFCCVESKSIKLLAVDQTEKLIESIKDKELIKLDLIDIFNSNKYYDLYIL